MTIVVTKAETDFTVQLERLGPLQEGDVILVRFPSPVHHDVYALVHDVFQRLKEERGLDRLTVIILEHGIEVSHISREAMKEHGWIPAP